MKNSIQTKAADAFVSFHGYTAAVCKLRNTSAVSIDYRIGGVTTALSAGKSAMIDTTASTSEVEVRRTDLSATPVAVQLDFGLDPDEAYERAAQAAAAAVAGHDADPAAHGMAKGSTYVCTHFTSNRLNSHIERLMVSISSDGVKWRPLGGLLYGDTVVRDPSSYFDGERWLVCYTNASVSSQNQSFSVCSSSDLSSWTLEKEITIAGERIQNVWAPEWFIDSDGPHIIFTIRLNTQEYDLYEVHPIGDINGAWSQPVRLTFTSETHKTNDNSILKVQGTYYLFYQETDTANIEMATASALIGPWTIIKTGDWAGWGGGYEGPSVISLPHGGYRIYISKSSPVAPVSYYYSDSSDLLTWSAIQPLDQQVNMQHGTFRVVSSISETSLISAIAASIDPNTNVNGADRIAPTEQRVYSYPDVGGRTVCAVFRDLQNGVILGASRFGAFIGPYTPAGRVEVRLGNGLNYVAAYFPPDGGFVMPSPDGTLYKLQPANGGGTATWVPV